MLCRGFARSSKSGPEPKSAEGIPLGGGKAAAASDEAAVPTATNPPSLFALPLARRPAFPGFYQTVQVVEPEILEFLYKLSNDGRGEYLGGFLTVEGSSKEAADADQAPELEEIGTALRVVNLTRFPNAPGGQVVVMPQNRVKRTRVIAAADAKGGGGALAEVEVEHLTDPEILESDMNVKALHAETVATMRELLKANPPYKDRFEQVIRFYDLNSPLKVASLIAGLSSAPKQELQAVLAEDKVAERLQKALFLVRKDLELTRLHSQVKSQVEEQATKQHKRIMLMEQLKHIKRELGLEKDDKQTIIAQFKELIKDKTMGDEATKVVEAELGKLANIEPSSSEFNVVRTYLEWLTSVPWGTTLPENRDIAKAEEVLHEDHHGLEDVKERILEHIAVSFLKESVQGKIMCLVGPPGVGKTSVGKSIARALDRKFFRFSVGGLHDVAEIRGHRRTYVGAMPGKLIQCLKVTGALNPVVLIDEIDKLGRGAGGDPSSALLEVLDPEQNCTFRDHYLDVPVDLSQVLFICTANVLDTIPGPLLDRMEVIRIAGYVHEEKVAIANQYLIPQTKKDSGVGEESIDLQPEALDKMIKEYAREAGVRQLRKLLEKVSRKVALNLVRKGEDDAEGKGEGEDNAQEEKTVISAEKMISNTEKTVIDAQNLSVYIGQPVHTSSRLFPVDTPAGVVTGLAWTSMGGVILYIEAVGRKPEKSGGQGMMKVTGNLKSVMTESASISLTYARLFVRELTPENRFLNDARIHLHVPEGATPKDGPSAGVTMATALVSLALDTPVRTDLAMTGELTLTGKVLKVGGIKEKVIGARREGVTTLLLPRQNEADYTELKDYLREGLTAHFVDHFDDIYRLAFDQTSVPVFHHVSRGLPVVTVETPAPSDSSDSPSVDLRIGLPGMKPSPTPEVPASAAAAAASSSRL